MNTTQIGDITEQKFILYCLEKQIPISKPIGNNLPYDFIIDVNNRLLRVQVKTSSSTKSKDTIVFSTRTVSKNRTAIMTKDYIGKIDYFVTYCDGIKDFLFIPVEKSSIGSMVIYYGENPISSQNLAKDYLFAAVVFNG